LFFVLVIEFNAIPENCDKQLNPYKSVFRNYTFTVRM